MSRSTGAPARALLPMLLAWAIPGAGHIWLGRRVRGSLYLAALVSTFFIGYGVTRGRAVSVHDHYYAFIAQAGGGLMAVVPAVWRHVEGTDALSGRPPDSEIPLYAHLDLGLLYTMVAGLLNLVLVHDVYGQVVDGPESPPETEG